MKKLIVLRNAGFAGGIKKDAGYLANSENRGYLNRKEIRRLQETARRLRPELEGLSFRIFCSNVPLVQICAHVLAKELGNARVVTTNLLGEAISSQPDYATAMRLVQKNSDQADALILVVYQSLANGFPNYFGKHTPGVFPIDLYRSLSKAEGLIINLEKSGFRFTGSWK